MAEQTVDIRTSKASTWSLICGIAGMLLVFPAFAAVILGIVALQNITSSAGALKGQGKAIAGIILGGVALLMWPLMGIIIAISIPNYIHYKEAAMDAKVKSDLKAIAMTVELYNAENGNYPSDEKGLPNDPWGRPYQYKYPGHHLPYEFDLWSSGKDGIDGTEDDITVWEK